MANTFVAIDGIVDSTLDDATSCLLRGDPSLPASVTLEDLIASKAYKVKPIALLARNNVTLVLQALHVLEDAGEDVQPNILFMGEGLLQCATQCINHCFHVQLNCCVPYPAVARPRRLGNLNFNKDWAGFTNFVVNQNVPELRVGVAIVEEFTFAGAVKVTKLLDTYLMTQDKDVRRAAGLGRNAVHVLMSRSAPGRSRPTSRSLRCIK